MISIKNEAAVEKMRVAGGIVVEVLEGLKEFIKPGITTLQIDEYAERIIRARGGIPTEKGYRMFGIPDPFPASVCASINDEVVHGIPSADRVLNEGDIITVDIIVGYEGYHGDACYTYPVGKISPERQELIDVTKTCLDRAIATVKAGATLGDVGHAVESYALAKGYGVVRDYAGHGIGKRPHEAPSVLNYGEPGTGVTLISGMTLAIEPMITAGTEELITGPDGWLVSTADGSDAAHFERTVLVTPEGADILTPWR